MDAFLEVARVFARFSFYRRYQGVVLVELLYWFTLAVVAVTAGLAIIGVPGAVWLAGAVCLLTPFVLLAYFGPCGGQREPYRRWRGSVLESHLTSTVPAMMHAVHTQLSDLTDSKLPGRPHLVGQG